MSRPTPAPLFTHIPHPHIVQRQRQGPARTVDQRIGFNGRLAVAITNSFGSMWGLYVLMAWMFGWMVLAQAGVWLWGHDRYPFSFLLFLSNLVQLFALPVILVGQAVLGRAGDRRAEQTFNDAEAILHEATQLQEHLAAQDAHLLEQDEKIERAAATVAALASKFGPSPPAAPDH